MSSPKYERMLLPHLLMIQPYPNLIETIQAVVKDEYTRTI